MLLVSQRTFHTLFSLVLLCVSAENYFAEVEQLAFCPSHMVPGIEPSPDKMLQGRLFSYTDTHRHRLGPNYQQLPVNRPLCAVTNYQRDGFMAAENQGGAPNYWPNSFGGPVTVPTASWQPHSTVTTVRRYVADDEDNFSQVGEFFRKVLTAEERERLCENIASGLCQAEEFIQVMPPLLSGSIDRILTFASFHGDRLGRNAPLQTSPRPTPDTARWWLRS
jgi:catalase